MSRKIIWFGIRYTELAKKKKNLLLGIMNKPRSWKNVKFWVRIPLMARCTRYNTMW